MSSHDEAIEILEAYLLGQKYLAQAIIEKSPAESFFVDKRRILAIQQSINFLKNFTEGRKDGILCLN